MDLTVVKSFIIEHGLGGPEGRLPMDGLYNHLQTHKAKGLEIGIFIDPPTLNPA